MVERTCCKDDENVKGGRGVGIGKAMQGSKMLNNIFFINITYFAYVIFYNSYFIIHILYFTSLVIMMHYSIHR